MSDLVKFDFEGNELFLIRYKGRECWVASQVANAIGYKESKTLTGKITGEWYEEFERGKDFDVLRGKELSDFKELLKGICDSGIALFSSQMTILYESGIYAACLLSRVSSGRKLRKWLSTDVIPSIRQHGGYSVQKFETPSTFGDALLLAGKLEKEREVEHHARLLAETQIAKDRPKVQFAEGIKASSGHVTVSEFAKTLNNGGIPFGQNTLYIWMKEQGYLISRGRDTNKPRQSYIDAGWFQLETWLRWDAKKKFKLPYHLTVITGVGQTVLEKKIRENPDTWKGILEKKLKIGKRARQLNMGKGK